MTYTQHRDTLIKLAHDSIAYGLQHREILPVNITDYPEELQTLRATFVTLLLHKELRGCIGTLETIRPLVADVVHNAYAAAFNDHRFMPLTEAEFPQLEIHISILSPAEAVQFTSEQELLQQIQPGIDGLILEAEGRRGTFLPSVWESLPDKQQFLQHLKNKAGLPQDYWSEQIKIWRYHTEMIE
jgi:AmmeMemoRadiSam system protein A